MEELTDYEAERAARIAANRARLGERGAECATGNGRRSEEKRR